MLQVRGPVDLIIRAVTVKGKDATRNLFLIVSSN
jgi:hypothetical protein